MTIPQSARDHVNKSRQPAAVSFTITYCPNTNHTSFNECRSRSPRAIFLRAATAPCDHSGLRVRYTRRTYRVGAVFCGFAPDCGQFIREFMVSNPSDNVWARLARALNVSAWKHNSIGIEYIIIIIKLRKGNTSKRTMQTYNKAKRCPNQFSRGRGMAHWHEKVCCVYVRAALFAARSFFAKPRSRGFRTSGAQVSRYRRINSARENADG